MAKIFGGARAGNLPIEQCERLHLGVNLKTAKRLNITIPDSLLSRADEVVS